MRIFIAGLDGYLGWPLCLHLAIRGHALAGCDNFLRRRLVDEMGGQSAIPVFPIDERLRALQRHTGIDVEFRQGDVCDTSFIQTFLVDFQPEAIVHLADIPSAPYSMRDLNSSIFTQTNNLVGTLNILYTIKDYLPSAHLVKLGTMGEYGTPKIDITEGFLDIEFRGRKDTLPFPRQAQSWYHWSKVHSSNSIMFACNLWGIGATDVMQGIVFGTRAETVSRDPALCTRLDFDEAFGTIVNRFCCQATISHPLTLFGTGSQKRAFISLKDTIQCLTLLLENPPTRGQYRVVNQFQKIFSLAEMAKIVQEVSEDIGIKTRIDNVKNPRKEVENHYFNIDRNILLNLGYVPFSDIRPEIRFTLQDLIPQANNIMSKRDKLLPKIRWANDEQLIT